MVSTIEKNIDFFCFYIFVSISDVDDDKIESNEILELAKEQRMSTDIRKNIFCLIMTSEVYKDPPMAWWFPGD